jgi:RNA polymerase-binding transcription factor DksA
MATGQQHAPAGSGAPARSRAARGPTWRALLEAQWRARLEEVTELSLAYHDAAAVTAPAPAGRPADRNLRRLMRRAIAARRALADTDEALARLASGRYGLCEGCAAAVPAWLLVVAPEARYCLRCRPRAIDPLHFYCLPLTFRDIKPLSGGPSWPPGGAGARDGGCRTR